MPNFPKNARETWIIAVVILGRLSDSQPHPLIRRANIALRPHYLNTKSSGVTGHGG
jgi:hypothetical protein